MTQSDVLSVGIFGQTGLDRLPFCFGQSHQTLACPCGRLPWRLLSNCVVSTEEPLYEEAL